MTTPKRAFIAVDLPVEVVDELRGLGGALEKKVGGFRWVKPDTLHLTLKFLGEIEPEEFNRVAALVADGFEGVCEEFADDGAIELYVDGVGAFASPDRARVVWAGVGGEVDRLSRFASLIEEKLALRGFKRESRPYKPHLTLGRVSGKGRARNLTRTLDEHKQFRGVPWRVKSLVLYESQLLGGGAKHTPRAEYKLCRT